MSDTESSDYDYSIGIPRRHHSLYIEDGNLVFQVIVFGRHKWMGLTMG
jgi:hypothetical protein